MTKKDEQPDAKADAKADEKRVLGTGAAGDPSNPDVGAPPATQMPVDQVGDDVADVNLPSKEDKK